MDYTPSGEMLYKYQWQYVQNPPSVWSIVESAEDAELATLPCLGIFDNCNDIIKNLRMMHNAAVSNGAKGVLVKTPSLNKALSGSNFEIDDINITKMDIVFVGEPNVAYTLNMKEYEVTNTGFIVKSGNKNIVTISLSNSDLVGSPSTKDKLKSYLFATKVDTTTTTNASFPITGTQLKSIFSGTSQERCNEVATLINKYSNEYGLTTPERMAHFIGQIGAESNLSSLKEDYCYTKDRIKEIFGKVKYCDLFVGYETNLDECNGSQPASCLPQLLQITENLVVKDKYKCSIKLFDYTYSCRLGNGTPNSGDGGRFRGRAFLHLTGKEKYQTLQEKWNSTFPTNQKDFICSSDECEATRELLITDLDFAMKSSLAFWSSVNANEFAKTVSDDSITQVSSKVNGGTNGLSTRISITTKAYNTLK